MSLEAWIGAHGQDLAGLAWLLFCWLGYAMLARKRAKHVFCIASVLHQYRKQWMAQMLHRDNRIADASLLNNLERNASFLASTSLFVIAGLFTGIASSEKLHAILPTLPFAAVSAPSSVQFKLIIVLMIHIYAFFTFTWAMRQYGFCAVLLGAAPLHNDPDVDGQTGKNYVRYMAKVIDRAGHTYNYGLRAFYFSLTALAWLLNIWIFMGAVAFTMLILYGREFHSKTLRAMIGVSALDLK
ncbi:MAG TPA: DUF599 domain-containing protein [Marinagarivorans sp.]